MGPETARACKDFGALHCVFPAGNAVLAATEVEEIESANWRELGMPETLWTCRVKEFGPLIVSIDAEGNNYFENKKVEYNAKKEEVLEEIYKHVSFINNRIVRFNLIGGLYGFCTILLFCTLF